ncbi:YbaB/EbfC family nucleoid-associated protein [Roseimicrobium sp. ORNL1]|uniref:YbaB/EbfC family nucleoid-associated protein n=1 Tax=Roseimicrobium sp. ORNL1 TaxID=2711231 RepID=UPI0013E1AAE1|nr:YbaB/EbfC family nucleoid-associated protein [Roseimicrobium sp. ORNL1]QIF02198.1 YbaB/EbfC family nucleoid-associated protein [Roseimicrobium sp. ORNL1]
MNIQKMLKQMQRMQTDMAQTQQELAGKTVEGAAGGGRVKATANGAQEITSITIAKEVVDPEDVEMLQDLVLTAVQQALSKSKELAAGEMGKITQGMGLPPGMGF